MIKRALILAGGTQGSYVTNIRDLGPYEVKARLKRNGWQTEIINFTPSWLNTNDTILPETIDNFFSNADEIIVAVSASVNADFPMQLESVYKYVKENYPSAKIILGGIRGVRIHRDAFFLKYFDALFLGRSMEMFEEWLNNKDMSRYAKIENKPYYLNSLYNFDIERPLVCDLLEDSDFLTESDVVGFEIGLGCKFNCSFCNYPLRNSKTLHLSSEDAIVKSLQTAYDKYGITHFFVADDTVNEVDEKLELVHRAVKRLTFTPNLGGYVRMDVLANRPHQIKLLKEMNFVGYLFGIETFDSEASKLIRKKHMKSTVEDTVRSLKKEIPHAWIGASMIVGLAHDDPQELLDTLKYLISKDIINSVDIGPLQIRQKEDWLITDEGFLSDMDKNPEEFGYTVDKDGNWKSSTTDINEVYEFYQKEIMTYLRSKSLNQFNGFTFLNLKSFKLVGENETSISIRNKFEKESLFKHFKQRLNREVSKYIKNKSQQIREDYGT